MTFTAQIRAQIIMNASRRTFERGKSIEKDIDRMHKWQPINYSFSRYANKPH